MGRKINIEKIAEIAEVHPSTVSRALNNSPLIQEKTRLKIQEIARSNGYIPDAIAKSLHSGRTMIIGIIVPEISNSFYSCIIDTIEHVASQKGYNLIISGTRFDPDAEIAAIETMISRQVDGLVVCAASNRAIDVLKTFSAHIPIVLADTIDNTPALDHVYVDECAGILSAIQYLQQHGRTRIGCIADRFTKRRLDIFTNCLTKCGLNAAPEFLDCGDSIGMECGYQGLLALSSSHLHPDAVFAARDSLAIGIMRAAIDLKVDIPSQLAVIGYDDASIANYMYKKLSTVHQPTDIIGESVATLILKKLHGSSNNDESVTSICLTPDLIIREST